MTFEEIALYIAVAMVGFAACLILLTTISMCSM